MDCNSSELILVSLHISAFSHVQSTLMEGSNNCEWAVFVLINALGVSKKHEDSKSSGIY